LSELLEVADTTVRVWAPSFTSMRARTFFELVEARNRQKAVMKRCTFAPEPHARASLPDPVCGDALEAADAPGARLHR